MTRVTNEEAVLRRIANAFPSARSAVLRLGMGDDAALLAPRPGYETILTCDWFLERTHFLRDKHPARAVGWKCLARAVSDIAAMGGTPRCFLISLALPSSHTSGWLDDFLRGLRRASRRLQCELAGGDTTRRSEILINITVAGEVATGRALLRSGATRGDLIFVSGTLGEAERGLQHLRSAHGRLRSTSASLRKHLYPEPRIALGQWLAEKRLATAAMDLSDGLSSDLPRLCAASGVGALVDAAALPTMGSTREPDALRLALHGGDDYELLFTLAVKDESSIPRRFQGLALTNIGKITDEKKILLKTNNGTVHPLERGGWDPFRE